MKLINKWKRKGNEIGDEGARMISEGLKSNSTLTELDLRGEGEYKMKENKKNIIEQNRKKKEINR